MSEIKFKSVDDFDLKGKKVLLRVDINSSIDLEKNQIRKDPRIRAILPTLEALKDSAIVILAHQSRPGKKDFTSLELHANKLKEYLGDRVKYVDDIYGKKAINAIKALKPGEILVLDNVRKVDIENKNMSIEEAEQAPHIKTLAPLFDFYVNDAFGAAHRSQPSLIGWPTLICGPLVKKELEMVNRIFNPERPSVMLVGGAKADDKFKALKFNLEEGKLDYALVCGLTATMMILAKGEKLSEEDEKLVKEYVEQLKPQILELMDKFSDKILFPEDVAVEENGKRKEYPIEKIKEINKPIGDIGEKTIKKFADIIEKAKTVVANGPPGIFEKEIFTKGSFELVKAMAKATQKNGAYTVIGGGEMGTAAEMSGLADKISMISTGGGALLNIISGKKVPLIQALEAKAPK
ncbi:MAG: phosphoglycerate kinase [Promethearchaeota archaeon]